MRNLLNHFLRGLLLLVPMAGAIYVVWYLYDFLDNLIPFLKNYTGLSFVAVIMFITLFGSVASRYNTGIVNWFEGLIANIPLLNLIYSSIKDLMTSFMGDERKFNKPVLVKMDGGIYKPGFITSKDLDEIGMPGYVSVYLPHSYNISGNVYLVDKKNIKPINNKSSEVMKYIVSGGISGSVKT